MTPQPSISMSLFTDREVASHIYQYYTGGVRRIRLADIMGDYFRTEMASESMSRQIFKPIGKERYDRIIRMRSV